MGDADREIEPYEELATPEVYPCPHCDGEVPLSAAVAVGLLQCPSCGEQFFFPRESDVETTDSVQPDAVVSARRENELSALRIRQVSALRRGAIRVRSWCVIGAVSSVVVSARLVQMIYTYVRHFGWRAKPIGYALAIIALMMGAAWLIGRIVELSRELNRSRLQDPSEPADFSSLSDGSQHWKNLEQL